MELSFSLTPQHSLSEVLTVLVVFLSQEDRDNGHWIRLRPRILNDLNTVLYDGAHIGYSALFILSNSALGRQFLMEDSVLRGKITAAGLNAVISEGEDKGKSALFCLASSEGERLLIDDEVLRGKITVAGLNAVIPEGKAKGKSPLVYLAGNVGGRQLLINDNDLRSKITDVGLNAVIPEGKDKGKSVLWFLASKPEGLSLLKYHEELYENILLSGLVSTFLHDNNDGTITRYSVLAHILEDKNKHAILFDNVRLMRELTECVTLYLSSFEYISQGLDELSIEDYIIKLLLENTPGRFTDILSDNNEATNNFMIYLYVHTDLISSLAKFEDGQNVLQTYTSLYPKKLLNTCLVPATVKDDILRNDIQNLSVFIDQISQDMVITPANITDEDSIIYEYIDVYWWLLVSRTHPITREVVLEVGQDPDDVLVLDEAKMQAIKALLKAWLQANIREKFVDIIKEKDGIDFLLSFSDTIQNISASILQQSIVDNHQNTITVELYLQRSESGRELCSVFMSLHEQDLSTSSLSLFEAKADVDQNLSQSNHPT